MTCERWGGSLKLSSEPGRGTIVYLRFPKSVAPAWFVPEIRLRAHQKVVVADDDLSIHEIWKTRLAAPAFDGVQLIHASAPTDLTLLHDENFANDTLYLVDYEFLGHDQSGLDLIERMGIAARAVLVTSRYEDVAIQSRCAQLGVRLIPKAITGFVPIRFEQAHQEQERLDAILMTTS